jgi:hypothetical protein
VHNFRAGSDGVRAGGFAVLVPRPATPFNTTQRLLNAMALYGLAARHIRPKS